MRSKRLACAALVLVVLAACQRPMEKMVEVSGRLFVFNYRVATATYLVTLRRTGPIPDGASIVAEFENPAGGAPLVSQDAIIGDDEKIVVQSANVHCVRKDKPYKVTIRVLGKDGTALQELQTQLVSDVDQTIVLPGKPLVTGPLYTQNPEVFRADGTTDYGKESCPTN